MKCLNNDPHNPVNNPGMFNAIFLQQSQYYAAKDKSLLELAKITQKKKLQKRLCMLRRYLIYRRKARQKRLLQDKRLATRRIPKPAPRREPLKPKEIPKSYSKPEVPAKQLPKPANKNQKINDP